MILKNNLSFIILYLGLIFSSIPFLLNFSSNIFINDYYAKRLMMFSFTLLPFYFFNLPRIEINRRVIVFFLLICFYIIYTIFITKLNNFILPNLIQLLIPIIFIVINSKFLNYRNLENFIFYFLIVSSIITLFDVKLQYSYINNLFSCAFKQA